MPRPKGSPNKITAEIKEKIKPCNNECYVNYRYRFNDSK